MLLMLALALATGLSAQRRGYNFAVWIFAGGLVGLVILYCLPDANEVKTPMAPEEVLKLRKRGNYLGIVLSLVSIIIGVLIGLAKKAQS